MTNVVVELDDTHYISYNNGNAPSVFDFILMDEVKIGTPETAFVIDDAAEEYGMRFLILFGDWRKEFQEAWNKGGEVAAIELFMKNSEHMADCSDRPKEVGLQ